MKVAANPIFQHFPDPTWIIDLETGCFLDVNQAALVAYGYSRDEFLGMSIADLAVADGAGGPLRHRLKSGEVIFVEPKASRIEFQGRACDLIVARDITRLVLAEHQAGLARPHEQGARGASDAQSPQFQRMFESVPGLFLVYEPQNRTVIAVSDSYLEAIGTTRDALIGQTLFDALPQPQAPGWRAKLRSSCDRVLASGRPDRLDMQEFVLQSAGLQTRRYWAMSNTPVIADDGRVQHGILCVQDLTDAMGLLDRDAAQASGTQMDLARLTLALKSDNARLNDIATRLRTTQRLLDFGTWDFLYAENRLVWSENVYEMYGIADRSKSVTFDDYVNLVSADDRDAMRKNFEEFSASDDQYISFAHQIKRPDGRIVHVHGVGERVQTATGPRLTGVVQNITDHIEAARTLARTKRLLEIAGTSAKFGAWRYDVASQTQEWSPQTALIHDEPTDFAPSAEAGIAYYAPEYRERIAALFQNCLTHGEPFTGSFELITAKKRRIWVRATGEAERDAIGRIVAVQGSFQDITELITVRQRAEESEKLLELAGRAVKLGGWRVSLADRKVFWTDGIAAIHEEPPGTVPSFDGGIDYFAPSERDCARAVFEACARDGVPFDNVRDIITAKGNRVRVRTLGEAVRDDSGRIVAVAGGMQDISELTAAQEKADALTSRLAQTLENIGDAFITVDRDWRFTYLNGRAVVLLRKSKEELLGQKLFDVFPDAIGTLFEEQYIAAMTTGVTVRFEHFYPPLEAMFRIHAHPTQDGLAIYFADISEERRRDEQLRLSEARFRLISLATGNALWEWDIEHNKDWWSDGLTGIYGHSPDQEDNQPTVWRANVHPEDMDRLDAAMARLRSGESELLHERYRFRRADGTWAQVEDRAIAIRDESGAAIRVLGSMSDVSEQMKMEDRLRQSQRLEAVGQLTGGVAHDFNNLLTVILGNMEMLQFDLDENHPLRGFVNMTIKAADRAAELTSRLLAFSRKQALMPKVLDVNQTICGIEGILRRTLGEHIDIRVLQKPGLWRTEVDEGQLEAALLNLAINSRDAMPDGGTLTIETANATLDDAYIATEPDIQAGDYVVIVFSDSGHGIAHDQLDRIFEPFFTTKAIGKGTGLGLSMVYGFVKQSGGHVRVYSEPDEGTTFRLYFPRYAGDMSDQAPTDSQTITMAGRETILVVEDDAMILAQLTTQLEGLGYKVLLATEGGPALEILQARDDVDLLFTDVILPGGMNGRQIADAAQILRPGLKVLYTSGYSETAILQNGRLASGVELLSKPYRRADLAAKIRKVLDQ